MPAKTASILLVTEHEATGNFLNRKLLRYDLDVEICSLGVMAIERLSQGRGVKAIILDSDIPNIDGILRIIKALKETPYLIALMRSQSKAPEWAQGMLSPPFRNDDITATLKPFAKPSPISRPKSDPSQHSRRRRPKSATASRSRKPLLSTQMRRTGEHDVVERFDGLSMPEVLFKLFREKRTGTLRIRAEKDCQFRFLKGKPVGLAGKIDQTKLAEILVKLDYIALADIIEMLGSNTLGNDLVRQLLITQTQHNEAMALLVFESLAACFTWKNARVGFVERDIKAKVKSLNPLLIIHEGLKRYPGFPILAIQIAEHAYKRIVPTSLLDAVLTDLPDEPWITPVVEACRKKLLVRELTAQLAEHKEPSIGLLYILLEGGMAELEVDSNTSTAFSTGASESAPSNAVARPSKRQTLFKLGEIVSDRYRIETLIGEGSTSLVYQATDLELDEHIALKVFDLGEQNPEYLQRFRQELSIARSLTHPNIIRVHDIAASNGLKYMTMELLNGKGLDELMGGTPFDLDWGLECLIQACYGLQAAHEQGIIHRDVKPDNFYVTQESVLKIMDFGIAKRRSSGMTMHGFSAGTPAYISPEQIMTFTSVTTRSDIYALGVVAYEMFTGKLPFWHEDLETLLKMHLHQEPIPARLFRPEMPEALDQLLLKLLAKDPDDRVQTCHALAEQLDTIRLGLFQPFADEGVYSADMDENLDLASADDAMIESLDTVNDMRISSNLIAIRLERSDTINEEALFFPTHDLTTDDDENAVNIHDSDVISIIVRDEPDDSQNLFENHEDYTIAEDREDSDHTPTD